MRIIVISRCLGFHTDQKKHYHFHFKGIFYGHKVESIAIEQTSSIFKKKVDYILDLTFLGFRGGTLLAKVERSRKLWHEINAS